MELKYSKKKQTTRYHKRRIQSIKITESQLQKSCEDVLNAHRIKYLRIPDWVWRWIKWHAPPQIVKALSDRFGGVPDIVALEPIGKYNLALLLELKTKTGKLHGKQKHWTGNQISRDPDKTKKIIREFINDAKKLRSYYDRTTKRN